MIHPQSILPLVTYLPLMNTWWASSHEVRAEIRHRYRTIYALLWEIQFLMRSRVTDLRNLIRSGIR